jgi:hypothetical protein
VNSKELRARLRRLQARSERLIAEKEAIEAKLRRKHVAQDCAAFLQEIEELDLRSVSREKSRQLLESSTAIRQFLHVYTTKLEDRLRFAFARERLLKLLPTFKSAPWVFAHFAYWRDYFITRLLKFLYETAKQAGDRAWMDRIEKAQATWDRVDKGVLAKSPEGKEALALLRISYFLQQVRLPPGLRRREVLLKADEASPELVGALSKAKKLRSKRLKAGGMTEEANRRADIMAYGIMRQLSGTKAEDWKTLLGEIAPDWSDDPRNFQKLLRECMFPFKSAGRWRGSPQCVRPWRKNIHMRR